MTTIQSKLTIYVVHTKCKKQFKVKAKDYNHAFRLLHAKGLTATFILPYAEYQEDPSIA